MITAILNWCVDILNWLAAKAGMTYEEVNVWIFCVIWPLITVGLIAVVIVQRSRLRVSRHISSPATWNLGPIWWLQRKIEVESYNPVVTSLGFLAVAMFMIKPLTDSKFLAEFAKNIGTTPQTLFSVLLVSFSVSLGYAVGTLYGPFAKIYEEHRKERYLAWVLLEMKTSSDDSGWIAAVRERLAKEPFAFPSTRLRSVISLAWRSQQDVRIHAAALTQELTVLSL